MIRVKPILNLIPENNVRVTYPARLSLGMNDLFYPGIVRGVGEIGKMTYPMVTQVFDDLGGFRCKGVTPDKDFAGGEAGPDRSEY